MLIFAKDLSLMLVEEELCHTIAYLCFNRIFVKRVGYEGSDKLSDEYSFGARSDLALMSYLLLSAEKISHRQWCGQDIVLVHSLSDLRQT